MRRYKNSKNYVWNANIAYLAGLIASDGCLINNGRHLNLTSKDIELINIVQSILEMEVKVSIKKGQFGTSAYHLQFSNVALYDFFLSAGLTPAKSKTIGRLLIPNQFYGDFLRGYFDGDGTVYGYWDPRWKSSLMYYVGFVSASPQFLAWLQLMNSSIANTTLGKIKPGQRVEVLTYAKRDSRKLFDLMYHSPGICHLPRKYTKFVDFLERDPYASMALSARVA